MPAVALGEGREGETEQGGKHFSAISGGHARFEGRETRTDFEKQVWLPVHSACSNCFSIPLIRW